MILEQTMKKKNFIRPTFYCVLVALPLTAVFGIVQSHHASLVLSHYFKGKTGNCSLAESFEGEALSRLQLENVNSIRAASKVVRRDERFSLWSTPAGEYWMPAASGFCAVKRNLIPKTSSRRWPVCSPIPWPAHRHSIRSNAG